LWCTQMRGMQGAGDTACHVHGPHLVVLPIKP
jgi:hypothetical protein